jgi:hypothetical protein
MENRIEEQMRLFAYRMSTEDMMGNQLRLYFSALAYTLVEALRRLALKDTEWAEARVKTIRLKLLKIGSAPIRSLPTALRTAKRTPERFRPHPNPLR